jgi:hypothetical protein
MTDVTIHFDPDKGDLLRRICFYEFVSTDTLYSEAEKHYTPRACEYPSEDVKPLRHRLSHIATAVSVLDQIGWDYGDIPNVKQITADRDWISKAFEREWRTLLDVVSGYIETTDDMRWSADMADFLAGVLDEIGWTEKEKPELVKVGEA